MERTEMMYTINSQLEFKIKVFLYFFTYLLLFLLKSYVTREAVEGNISGQEDRALMRERLAQGVAMLRAVLLFLIQDKVTFLQATKLVIL